MNLPIKIAMVEDHLVLRQGLISLLKDEKSISVIFDVNNGQELLDNLEEQKPDVVLLDIDMPVMDGREALKHIVNDFPEIKVIMLTMHFSAGYIVSFLKEGASAFLPKGAGIEEIVLAIKSVFAKGYYHSDRVLEIIESQARLETEENAKFLRIGLTDREAQILKLLRDKNANESIADALHISLRTVEWHRQNLIGKLKDNGMSELINWSKKNLD
jgi:DNA-binding NarL/FixJ family response regulator